jgi:hypothetical protein
VKSTISSVGFRIEQQPLELRDIGKIIRKASRFDGDLLTVVLFLVGVGGYRSDLLLRSAIEVRKAHRTWRRLSTIFVRIRYYTLSIKHVCPGASMVEYSTRCNSMVKKTAIHYVKSTGRKIMFI